MGDNTHDYLKKSKGYVTTERRCVAVEGVQTQLTVGVLMLNFR